MRAAIIGCGAAGMARLAVLAEMPDVDVPVCVDQSPTRTETAARLLGCEHEVDWQRAVARDDLDAVILATATNTHAPIAIGAMQAGKHVFCESPIGRTPHEADQMLRASRDTGRILAAGAEHRFTPAARKGKELVDAGAIGRLLFLRGWSGQGSLGGVETWYADPELSGGGTLMSNGIALLDLARWLAGEFEEAVGYSDVALWPIEPVEDNAFGLFRSRDEGRVASLHSSWTQWKDLLRIEIFGSDGYLEFDLGQSRIVHGKRTEFAPGFEEAVIDLSPEPGRSRMLELEDFFDAIREGREPSSSGYDGLLAIQMAHAVYLSSEKRTAIRL